MELIEEIAGPGNTGTAIFQESLHMQSEKLNTGEFIDANKKSSCD